MGQGRRSARNKLISKYMKPKSVGLEIGVFNGGYAKKILNKVNLKKLYLIDPWIIQSEFPHDKYGG